MAAKEKGSGPVVLTRPVEHRLRQVLQVVLRDRDLNGDSASGEEGPQTLATLEVQGAMIAIVKIQVQSSASLSRRQREISRLVARGLTNKEIAQELHLRAPTVAAQLQRIFRKLDITTRAALAGLSPLLV